MEIGSEYWLENMQVINKKEKVECDKVKLLISGRTAIDYALTTMQKYKKIKIAYLPSYCCESIIKPFIENNIELKFYTVDFNKGNLIYNIDENVECDIFFAMNYFGFSYYNMDKYIEKYKNRNVCVIEDATHSLLSTRIYNENSDFVVASMRKWFPIISGGLFINQSNKYKGRVDIKLKQNFDYIRLKEEAMLKKAEYINKNVRFKNYLKIFSKANEILNKNYKNYAIDEKSYNILQSINIEEIKRKRKNNANIIYEFLRKQKEIEYLVNINLKKDCPIFVPIFLKNESRNSLKKFLIDNEIYCPTHWKIPEQIKKDKEQKIYNMELSLICDQRYKEEDIEGYIKLIMRGVLK